MQCFRLQQKHDTIGSVYEYSTPNSLYIAWVLGKVESDLAQFCDKHGFIFGIIVFHRL